MFSAIAASRESPKWRVQCHQMSSSAGSRVTAAHAHSISLLMNARLSSLKPMAMIKPSATCAPSCQTLRPEHAMYSFTSLAASFDIQSELRRRPSKLVGVPRSRAATALTYCSRRCEASLTQADSPYRRVASADAVVDAPG